MPKAIAALLDSKALDILGRVLLTFAFWISGLMKLADFNATIGEMAHFNLNPPVLFAALTIFVQLVGSALVIWGAWAWLGAGMLGVFTALTIPLVHPFWSMAEPQRTMEMHVVTEHVSVIGALILVAIMRYKLGAPRTAGHGLRAPAAAE